jgi:uncharacterized protein YlxP (DUF503 family)
MVVGVLTACLRIPDARSLKDRRSAVRSLTDRLRSRFNVSVSDVGQQDARNIAIIAVAVVTSRTAFAHEVLGKALRVLEQNARVVVESVDVCVEPYAPEHAR